MAALIASRCETWADHEFGSPRLVASWRSQAGWCRRTVATCARCGRQCVATERREEPAHGEGVTAALLSTAGGMVAP